MMEKEETAMTDDEGLIAAYLLDGDGGGEEVDWHGIHGWSPDKGAIWIHLDRGAESSRHWITEDSGLDPLTAEALLAAETRPRSFSSARGLFVVLRGVNLNPGADPEDMVGLRIWLEEHRIISVRYRRLVAVSDLRELIDQGRGPTGPGDFLDMVADRLVERMGPVINDIGERIDTLEAELEDLDIRETRQEIRHLRQTAIVLRRHLAPQRDVLGRLQMEQAPWLSQENKMALREIADRTTRYVEELDEIRERSVVLQDELFTRLSEEANRTIYILTVVAAIMLPLSFLTGLLGINVGGIPLAENKDGFWIVIVLLTVFGAFELWLFRKLKWI